MSSSIDLETDTTRFNTQTISHQDEKKYQGKTFMKHGIKLTFKVTNDFRNKIINKESELEK